MTAQSIRQVETDLRTLLRLAEQGATAEGG